MNRIARVRCGCGERIGFVIPGRTEGSVDIQLRRVNSTPWFSVIGGTDPAQLNDALDALDVDRDEVALLITGCPKCRRMLTIPKDDIRTAVTAFDTTGKTQDLEAVPHDRPSTE